MCSVCLVSNKLLYVHVQALVDAMAQDLTAYRLPPALINEFGLAPENYGDHMFIHPPLYVLLCVAARRICGMSLPAVSLLCHTATCVLIAALPHALFRLFLPGKYSFTRCMTLGTWAVLIYTFCPIVSFVSQKVTFMYTLLICVALFQCAVLA